MMQEYVLSENIKSELKKVKKFETGSSKISSYSAVRSLFGIPEDEEIVSYRVIPKMFAKLDKGGLIFTDKGVYTYLTSSGLKNDYTKYSFAYSELLSSVVFYSAKEFLPVLIDSNLNVHKLWTWTLLQGAGDEDIAVAMNLVLQSMLLDENYKTIRVDNCRLLLEKLKDKQEKGDGLSEMEASTLDYLLLDNIQDMDYLIIANFVLFEYYCRKGDFDSARSKINMYEGVVDSELFKKEVDDYIENRFDYYKESSNQYKLDEFELYCELTKNHLVECFQYVITLNLLGRSYSRLSAFLEKFKESEYYEEIRNDLLTKIELEYEMDEELWANDEYDASKYFFEFLLTLPEFFEKSLYSIIMHYCNKGEFLTAKERLKKIKEEYSDKTIFEEVEKMIDNSVVTYCDAKYTEALNLLEEGKNKEASSILAEISKLMPRKMEYRVSEIETLSKLEKYSDVKMLIEKLSPFFGELSVEQKNKVDECAIKYAEYIHDDMKKMYDLVVDSNCEELYSDNFEKANHYDNLGMCFYHYAILLNKLECVKTYILDEEDIHIDGDYGFIDFAFGNGFNPDMYRTMVRHYDSEAREARKKYDKKKTLRKVGNAILDAGAEVINSAVDSTLNTIKDTATKASADYENMMNDSSYDDYSDRLSEKMEAASNAICLAEELKATIPTVPKFSTRSSGNELWDEYNQSIDEIAERKFDFYQNKVEQRLRDSRLGAKLIYTLIKDRGWLEKMYSSDHSDFELYIDTETLVYLPKGLIDVACELYKGQI